MMWFAHIWLDSESLQSYQAITISSWWDQSICAIYKFSGRNICQVMNNTILSSEAMRQQNTTLVQITCELFSIHSRNLLWWLSKIWTTRNNLLLFENHYATFEDSSSDLTAWPPLYYTSHSARSLKLLNI